MFFSLYAPPTQPRATASHQTYFEEIRQLFYRDEYSLLAEKWNAQRAQAVAHALLKVLYPLMEKELRVKLLTEAKEHVLQVMWLLCRADKSCRVSNSSQLN